MMIWIFEFRRGGDGEASGLIYIREAEKFAYVVPFLSRTGDGRELLLFLRLR